jgi:tetratricopeptide (TPR) repeat protein
MGAEEALVIAERLVFTVTGEHLSDLRRKVFQGAWEGQTYEQIANSLGYNESYIKEEGAGLCKLLSEVLQEKVTKTSFRAALERRSRLLVAAVETGGESAVANIETLPPIALPPEANGRTATIDPTFVGREKAIADLDFLVNQGAKVILIQGAGGVGKTTLALRYFKMRGFDPCLELWMATETNNIASVESVVEEWLRRDFNEEPGREFRINLERLRRRLRDQTQRVGVLIDNLEPALDGHGKFIAAHRAYVELLRVLSDPIVQSVTLITSRERLSESSVGVYYYPLEGLDETAWQHYLSSCKIDTHSAVINQIWKAYGGNAKAMQILSGAILTDFSGDIEAYWQENRSELLLERELKDIVTSQFNRLQTLNPEAHKLLCRLGCYRYQDVPTIGIEGLVGLLWDIPESECKFVVKALQDLSLVESHRGQYWLHPVIRVEAISRLRTSQDWESTHRQAAQFWTDGVQMITTVNDTRRALEAYHHYVEIGDFDRACDIIVQPCRSKWGENIPLGWLFYRLGVFQPMIGAITRILDEIRPDQRLGRLYNLLGYTYRLTGNIQKSLVCHQEADTIAETFHLNQLKISALFNVGLCYGDLWELEEAIAVFKIVDELAEQTPGCSEYSVYSKCCLAFFSSCMGDRPTAASMAETIYLELDSIKLTSWGTGYSLLFLGLTYQNLGDPEKSFDLFCKTLTHAEENHFTQIKAKSLHGVADFYRRQNDFTTSIAHQLQAIELLEQIGAKCDLGEAYLQLGLTYQQMGEIDLSQAYLQNAIQLFTEINAPNQVNKVLTVQQ